MRIRRESRTSPSNIAVKDRRAHRTYGRRLRRPEPVPPYEGLYYVQDYSKSCPQQFLKLPNGLDSQLVHNINKVVGGMYDAMRPTDEDCKEHVAFPSRRELNDSRGLTINVVKPSYAMSETRLPVVVVGNFPLASCHDGLHG